MVSVCGAHASGRTTFIHLFAYQLGYALTEQQVEITRLRTGGDDLCVHVLINEKSYHFQTYN
jgi:hypothetical protein